MADMNKRPNTHRSQLEDELVGRDTDQQAQVVETGKYRNFQDPYSQQQEKRYHRFNVVQGHRRRHPDQVLQQHQAIRMTGEDAKSVWEQALVEDDERTKLPEVYKASGFKIIPTQVGLQDVAAENYKKKKNKMSRLGTVIGM